MSVINQMLRDLEARKEKESVQTHYIDEINIIADKRNSKYLYLWFIAGFGLLLAAVLLYFFQMPNHSQKNTKLEKIIDLPVELAAIESYSGESKIIEKSVIKAPDRVQTDKPAILTEIKKSQQDKTPGYKSEPVHKNISRPEKNTIRNSAGVLLSNKKISTDKAVSRSKISQPGIQKSLASVKPVTALKPEVKQALEKVPVKYKIEPVKDKQLQNKSEGIMLQARNLMITDLGAAILLLEKELQTIPPNVDYYSLLANLYQRQQRYDDAIVFYQKALKKAPQKGNLWVGIALAYRSNGEYADEQNAFKKAALARDISPALRQYAIQQVKKK